jgi:hypothetical protein
VFCSILPQHVILQTSQSSHNLYSLALDTPHSPPAEILLPNVAYDTTRPFSGFDAAHGHFWTQVEGFGWLVELSLGCLNRIFVLFLGIQELQDRHKKVIGCRDIHLVGVVAGSKLDSQVSARVDDATNLFIPQQALTKLVVRIPHVSCTPTAGLFQPVSQFLDELNVLSNCMKIGVLLCLCL